MKHVKYLSLLLLAGLLHSCGTYTADKTYRPDVTQLQINMNDLKCVGETTVEVDYRTYLGFIRVIDEVNGQVYDSTNKRSTVLKGCGSLSNSPLKRAMHKVLEENPGAHYFQVVNTKKEKQNLFLGTTNKVKATVRAYKFK